MKKLLILYKLNILTLSYGLNLISIPLITIFLVKFKYINLAGEFSFFTSIIFIFCQIFSTNSKNILISDQDLKYGLDILFFRVCVGLIFTIFVFSFIFFIKSNYYEIILLYCFLIIFQWIYEIKLIFDEIEKKIKSHLFFIFIYLFKLLLIFNFLRIGDFFLIHLLIFFVLFFYSLTIFNFIKKKTTKTYFLNFKSLLVLLEKQAFKYSLTSSFWNNIGIISWRFSIFVFVEKSLVAVYFVCFALASLPGTILNLTIGPTLVKEIGYKKNFLVIIIFVILTIYTMIIYNYFPYIIILGEFEKNFLLKFSLIGTFFMTSSIIIRHYYLKFSDNRNVVFKHDVIYSLILSFLVLLIYYFDKNFIYLSYLFASILSFILYFLLIPRLENAKK